MERVTFDGLDECSECRRPVGVWKTEKGRRLFIEHFLEYPTHCKGAPQQAGRTDETGDHYEDEII